jgi:competence protein ComEC
VNKFSAYPFLRITPAFILGIVVFHYLSASVRFSPFLLAVSILLFVLFSIKDALKYNWLLGVLSLIILFFFGYFRLQQFKEDSHGDHLIHYEHSFDAYLATIIEVPEAKANSIKTIVSLNKVYANQKSQDKTGKINIYLDKELGRKLKYGDQLLIKGQPNLMLGPKNLGEFDYRNYLVYNNIFHQHFVGDKFVVLGNEPPSIIMLNAFKLRERSQQIVKNLIHDEAARGVVLALVLGIKDELDVEVLNAYSAAGAMHILAVSGLHVGIIYGIILLLFKQLGLSNKKNRWLLAVVSIAALWTYAFVTGLSPSVLRAVTMFSFVAIGKATVRRTNIYNTLAASAFVLLWYNPYLIMSVGFQLSYLAVFGIVFLQPKFYSLLIVRNVLLDKIWAITCVSLAAQITTGPLSILYFHQFPTYFFLSNLFIIPAALVILVLGLMVLLFGWIPFVGEGIAWLLSHFVAVTNTLVFAVEGIPGSVIQGINLKTYDSWLVYLSIWFMILLFAHKRFKFLLWASLSIVFFALSQFINRSKFINNSDITIFNVGNASVLDFSKSNQTSLIGDSAYVNDENKLRFSIQPKRLTTYQDINVKSDKLNLQSSQIPGADLFVFEGNTFLSVHDAKIQDFISARRLPIDIIILSKSAISEMGQLTDLFIFGKLIIDGSNRKYLVDKLTSQAEALNLDVHSIYEDGFLQLKMLR